MGTRQTRIAATAIGVAALLAVGALAETADDRTARLGGPELTPVGAERAGNGTGTIPAWTGGITRDDWPAGYEPGDYHPDPFAEDPVLFTIAAENAEEHAAHLSPGQVALLKAYPETWRMRVHASRRSASYPNWVYEAIEKNAAEAWLVPEGGGTVRNASISSPFPVPTSGIEVVWNHLLRFRGVRIQRTQGSAAVTRAGRYNVVLSIQDWAFPYAARERDAFGKRHPNLLIAIKDKVVQPAALSGNGSLIHEPIDQTKDPRRWWSYDVNLRRVLRLPHAAYDFTPPDSDGLATIDDFMLYNGSPDRFDWKLLGKREMYIPYNAYALHNRESVGPILQRGHINPDLARYELHRVWVVEGTLKPGAAHVYGRRVFFVDEDTWQIAVAESYDLEGELWRVNEGHVVNYYEVPAPWTTLEVFHDLVARRYLATGLDNGHNAPRYSEGADPREFTANALTYYVR